jgi:glycolate oxidase iron-sulfur subunit
MDLPTVRELEECIRCGLCLSVCPTYRPTGVEGDSPRGRVALVKAQLEGKADPDSQTFLHHMDLCLQCMACAAICPTGVNAGTVVARQKAYRRATRPRSLGQRVLFHALYKGLFPHYGRLEAAALPLRLYRTSGLGRLVRAGGLLDRLPAPLAEMEAMLPERLGRPARWSLPELVPAHGARRARVAYHLCCINNIMFPDACLATVRVLARNGAEVVVPRAITCCGAPHETEGEMEVGRGLARRLIALYEKLDVDFVIADAAACGAVMKQYVHWLVHDPIWQARAARFSARVRDFSEFLFDLGLAPPQRRVAQRITYDDPCHLCHAQRITRQPRALLRTIPGAEFVELPEASWCCGSAGTYNITQPAMAETILRDKMEHLRSTRAEVVASSNPGCMLQLEAGMRRYGLSGRVRHVSELLDATYSR